MCVRINISLTGDTLERLDQYAYETHSSRSKALTDLIWKAPVKHAQLRGQISIDDVLREQEDARKRQGRRKHTGTEAGDNTSQFEIST